MIALSKNPPSRYPDKPIHESAASWWIAKVKPHQEKAFVFDLLSQGIEYYLPMYCNAYRRIDTGKLRKSMLPLFPSYVAVAYNQPYILLQHPRIATIITVKNQKRFVNELDQIYSLYNRGIAIQPVMHGDLYQKGNLVRVTAGVLKGTTGRIIRIESKTVLVLDVNELGCVSVKIDMHDLEANIVKLGE